MGMIWILVGAAVSGLGCFYLVLKTMKDRPFHWRLRLRWRFRKPEILDAAITQATEVKILAFRRDQSDEVDVTYVGNERESAEICEILRGSTCVESVSVTIDEPPPVNPDSAAWPAPAGRDAVERSWMRRKRKWAA